MSNNAKPIVIVSGGFDPVHEGHLKMIEEASRLGEVIVIVNSDKFLIEKKGFYLQNQSLRSLIMQSLKNVNESIISVDKDSTVNSSLKKIRDNYPERKMIFANGGDRVDQDHIPESATCKILDIEMLFNVGGTKINSSSDIFIKAESQFFSSKDPFDNVDVIKPWGKYKNLFKAKNFLIKLIVLNPGEELSRQYHNYRQETWVMVKGQIFLQVDNNSMTLNEGECALIPKGSIHFVKNFTKSNAIFAEVQSGQVISESDITRTLDKYNR